MLPKYKGRRTALLVATRIGPRAAVRFFMAINSPSRGSEPAKNPQAEDGVRAMGVAAHSNWEQSVARSASSEIGKQNSPACSVVVGSWRRSMRKLRHEDENGRTDVTRIIGARSAVLEEGVLPCSDPDDNFGFAESD